MKQEYKTRQEIYHHLNNPDDKLEDKFWVYKISTNEMIVADIIEYFTKPIDVLMYPSKSYAVAIIYAKLLHHFFGVSVIEALTDENLLYGNDHFFKPYVVGKTDFVYNQVIFHPFDKKIPQVSKTIDYFLEEFYLKPNLYFNNSNLINTTI